MSTRDDVSLPLSIRNNPSLDDWIRVDPSDTVTVFTGKVEIGQGIRTALTAIAAEELDLRLDQVRMPPASTSYGPNELYTASSQSIEDSGGAIRVAAAEARQALRELAAVTLGVSAGELSFREGVIHTPDRSREMTYWTLMGGRRFEREIFGRAAPKRPEEYSIVGKATLRRVDLLDKVLGKPRFLHDWRLPEMLHGRVLRPPSFRATLTSLDPSEVEAMPGVVAVVIRGSFVGVVAESENDALRACRALRARARWAERPSLAAASDVHRYLREHVSHRVAIVDGLAVAGEPPPPVGSSELRSMRRAYRRPHLLHGSLGPSCAVARFRDGALEVWTHNQGVHPLAGALAEVAGLPREKVCVQHVEGAGSYGHNGSEDAACDAVLLAMAVAPRPVSVRWSREDENAWEPLGPAMLVEVEAKLTDDGSIRAWNHDVWGTTHLARAVPGKVSAFIAEQHRRGCEPPRSEPWTGAPQLGGHRNADPLYSFEEKRIVEHFVSESPLRTSTLRSLGAYLNVLAIESFMDELSELSAMDPVELRLRHLRHERARAVLEKLAEVSRWSGTQAEGVATGRGLAIGQYKNSKAIVGVVVDAAVDEVTAEPRLLRAWLVADAGAIVDRDGLIQQLEGGFVQSASWTLKEAVQYDDRQVTTTDWSSYPVLVFSEVPVIETVLIDRPDRASVGAGEAAQGPTAAAITNALSRAIGVRLHDTPYTAARLRAAILQQE